jgi:hypothetical protein
MLRVDGFHHGVGGVHWALTMQHVRDLCSKHGVPAKVVTVDEYQGGPEPTIILDDGHYVCTWGRRYFDPYGEPPPPAYGDRVHETLPLQRQAFFKEGHVLDVNTCGKHCIMRLKHRDKTQTQYERIVGPHPDLTVAINV